MKQFTDNQARSWTVTINVAALKRVRTLLDVDLLEVFGGQLLEKLVSDPVMLCDVIYALCKPDADARSVSDEDFGRSMGGDSIETGTMALLEELADFFPTRRRTLLQKALQAMKRMDEIALDMAQKRLESGEMEKHLSEALSKALSKAGDEALKASGSLSGSSLESSDATPAP